MNRKMRSHITIDVLKWKSIWEVLGVEDSSQNTTKTDALSRWDATPAGPRRGQAGEQVFQQRIALLIGWLTAKNTVCNEKLYNANLV